MSVYEYTAKDETGSLFSGTYTDVDSVSVLRKELDKLGYSLVKARRKKTAKGAKGKIKSADVVTFAYKFAGMSSAGLSIIRCLEALEDQTENQAFKSVIANIRQNIETGSSLKNAFEKHKTIFSDFFIGMLEAGESGGKLSKTLEMAAAYLEKREDLKRKIKSAFAYPVVVAIMCFLIVGYLVVFVVPVFSKIYAQLHVALPGPTQGLITASVVTRQWWWLIVLFITGIVTLSRKLPRNPAVKARLDILKLNMPVFGKLNRMIVVSNFTRTFAILTSAGVSYLKALDVANQVANNCKVSEITGQLRQTVEAGQPLAESMRNYDIFPAMIVQLAAAGEEAGILPEMLNKGVDFLDTDIDRLIGSLLIKLEPALTVIMGSVVGFILMGVYLPMFDYMSHLK